MYLGDIVTFKALKPISFHSSILEHISSSLVRYPEVYCNQRFSEKTKTRLESVCVRLDTTYAIL